MPGMSGSLYIVIKKCNIVLQVWNVRNVDFFPKKKQTIYFRLFWRLYQLRCRLMKFPSCIDHQFFLLICSVFLADVYKKTISLIFKYQFFQVHILLDTLALAISHSYYMSYCYSLVRCGSHLKMKVCGVGSDMHRV